MRPFYALMIFLLLTAFVSAQSEQSPIQEKNFGYKDWTRPNLNGGGETNLRKFSAGKKLVMVVYWAPWCPNWRHDVEFVQELHSKYSEMGLAVIGVGEYDVLSRMRSHYNLYKLSFPSVYESESTAAREQTQHFSQRREAGDLRRWGTPWYVFLEPSAFPDEGEILAHTVNVVNGELIKDEVDGFIRGKLGLDTAASLQRLSTELTACEPELKPLFIRP
jgi:thiol-disulfide isomerase/thioredoxin